MRLLRGVLAGLLAAALGLAGVCAMLPAQTAYDPARLYDYMYSGTKSQSVPFTTASMSDDGHLAFGSSEFFISKDKVAQCPQAVFGENVTGVDLTYVGEAYDQSLWQAIAAGAYAGEAKNKKVMIVVSPQWFFKGTATRRWSRFSIGRTAGSRTTRASPTDEGLPRSRRRWAWTYIHGGRQPTPC
ncbi:MAG: D-alanyl-lipoteichoic acid biosynthesis protein DltD [Eggerthella lenta]